MTNRIPVASTQKPQEWSLPGVIASGFVTDDARIAQNRQTFAAAVSTAQAQLELLAKVGDQPTQPAKVSALVKELLPRLKLVAENGPLDAETAQNLRSLVTDARHALGRYIQATRSGSNHGQRYERPLERLDAQARELASLDRQLRPENRPGLEGLNAMVGLDEVKARIAEAIASARNGGQLRLEIFGPPGSGKTHGARKAMEELSLALNLSGTPGQVVGHELLGPYKGQTADRIARHFERQGSGVLILDDWQPLFTSGPHGEDAAAALAQQMIRHPEVPVIATGYEGGFFNNMEPHLKEAAGGRYTVESISLELPNYTAAELERILDRLVAGEGLPPLGDETRKAALQRIEARSQEPHFANARTVTLILSQAKTNMAQRLMSKGDPSELQRADFNFAPEDFRAVP